MSRGDGFGTPVSLYASGAMVPWYDQPSHFAQTVRKYEPFKAEANRMLIEILKETLKRRLELNQSKDWDSD